MKLRVSKKVLFIVVPIVLIGAAAGGYFFLKKDNSKLSTVETPKSKTEEQVDDLFVYLNEQADHSKFAALTTGALIKEKLTPAAGGVAPQIMMFAPKDEAFSKEDVGVFNATGADERILYHYALLTPAADGTKPSLDLTDGERIATLAGRDLLVRKTATKTVLIDTKGREVVVGSPYIIDPAGDRIYPIDSVLLLQ